jgi:hypothetical protein
LTIEVTPEQANALLLSQAAGAVYDFVLRSPLESGKANPAAATVTNVTVTRPQVAPYSTRLKAAAAATKSTSASTSGGGGGTRIVRSALPFPNPQQQFVGGGVGQPSNLRPLPPPQPVVPPTYDIPIYADGKLARVDTVRNPAAGAGVSGQ